MNLNSRREWWRPAIDDRRDKRLEAVAGIESGDSMLPFWALMGFTFVLLISPQSFIPGLASLRIAMLATAIAILSYAVDRFKHGRPVLRWTRELTIALCLLAWAVMTLPLSYWPGGSVASLLGLYIKTMIVFVLLTQIVTSLSRLRLVAWGLSLMAVPIACNALINLITANYLDGHARITGYNAPLTENPNDLALTLNLILPLSVALFFTTRKPAVRAVLLACICLDAVAVVATYSRGGFLTLVCICFTYLWSLFRRGQQQWMFLALFLGLAALPLLPSDYVERLVTIINISSDETGSAQERVRDTLAAVVYVLEHPLIGAGLDMNALALNEIRGTTWTVIHNVYLQYAVDLGIPGMVLFIMLLLSCLKGMRNLQERALESGSAKEIFFFAGGLRISLIAFAIAGMFHPVGYHFYFYYIAGLAVALKLICEPQETQVTDKVVMPAALQRRHL